MTQTLNEKLNGAFELGLFQKDIPDHITDNLAPRIELRPYQIATLERFLYYIDSCIAPSNPHLLFHMATGSGKTVLMAALILDLYKRGYRNFLFFVNSAQIIEKTKENFLNPASAKYLFSTQVRIEDHLVDIRAVEVFNAVSDEAINIHFTTIQGLHRRMMEPKENSVTIEDFCDYKTVMLSDEAHHLNTETKKRLTTSETKNRNSWESTVNKILCQHPENVLLEFTATIDFQHKKIAEKYNNKILYDYSLRQFREDGYSKDIKLRRASLPVRDRMLQAVILSQYRRKVAEAHGIHCKPVILMKSKTIRESDKNEKEFTIMIAELTGDKLQNLRTDSKSDQTFSQAFDYIIDEHGMKPEDFVHELKEDFNQERVANINKDKDLGKLQIQLNTLEDQSNELRVIFAVDKLNEGWDVLNLFDIVRLYDTRDSRANNISETTMAEAQLIGRGARYFPFSDPNSQDSAAEKRKYDSEITHPLRILEELHYHCSHNPRYIEDIRKALREIGMLDDTTREVQLRLKDSFKQSSFYEKGIVWANNRIRNRRENVNSLESYGIQSNFIYPTPLMAGQVTETPMFGNQRPKRPRIQEDTVSRRTFKLIDFGKAIINFAMDRNEFFHFTRLRSYFPQLTSMSQFQTSNAYLSNVSVTVRGLSEKLDNLTKNEKLNITQYVLHEIQSYLRKGNSDYVGTKEFKPYKVSECFTDKILKLRINEGEGGRSWFRSRIPELDQIDLASKSWYVYDDNYGTNQEKHFIKYVSDHEDRLHEQYDNFYLIRNEKAVKLFAFDDGQAFEPDFILFLRKKNMKVITTLQLFVESKGNHLKEHDMWKETFLKEIETQAKIITIFQGQDYVVHGLPFFNETGQTNEKFKAAFEDFL